MRKGNLLVSDLYVKPTDTNQYFYATLCLVFQCKKLIPFIQVLRLNRICSEIAVLINDAMNCRYCLKNEVTVTSWQEDQSLRQNNY